jgi:UDP-N-acetylmuramate dehydrogenase
MGANTLFSKDFDGLVIKMSILGKEIISEDKTSVLLKIGGGEDWGEIVKDTVDNNWSGIENLASIPGTAGAAPVQNIGAYGRELADVFEYLEAIDLETGEIVTFNKEDCKFGYRDSIFKKEGKGRYIITSIVIKLVKAKNNISLDSFPQYKSLKTELEKEKEGPYTLQDIYNAVVNIRDTKLPNINKYGSNGCFFTNPIINKSQLDNLLKNFPEAPHFDTEDPNTFKISAGWILEQLGWKGKREGDVGTWDKHSLIVVNYGNATGEEILEYTDKIKEDFFKNTGIQLEYESNIIQ